MDQKILNNLERIKSLDPDIREKTYQNLCEIFSDPKFEISVENLEKYIAILCGEKFLFFKIDEGITDGTVVRSFSLLVLALIVATDTKGQIEIDKIVEPLHNYLKEETDFRGKDENIGWIHTMAHLGDLWANISLHPMVNKSSIEKLSIVIINKIIALKDFSLEFGEDFRLGYGFYCAIKKIGKIPKPLWKQLDQVKLLNYPEKNNLLNLIRCIYIEFSNDEESKDIYFKLKDIINGY